MLNNDNKHILMVLESIFPTKGGGGAEKQVQTLCKNLPKHINTKIIVPRVSEGSSKTHDIVDGIEVIRIPYPHIQIIGSFIMLLKLAWYIQKNRRNIDAIHCHIANNMSSIACLLGSILHIPVVVKLTGWLEIEHGIISKNKNIIVKLKRYLIKKATTIQATSHDIEQALFEFGFDRNRVKFIPNSVDTERFKPDFKNKDDLKKSLNIDEQFIVTFIGRLVAEKSLDILFNAWAKTIPKNSSSRLLIIGDGYLRNELESLCQSLELQHQISFIGSSDIVSKYLKITDIGVLPSEFEGLSNALLESMSSAIPMIGSQVSGTVDLIENGVNGWLFEPKNEHQLSEILHLAYNCTNKERIKMGAHARKKIIQYSGIDHIISTLLKYYGFNERSW